ncbi:Na+/H+ antiporter NhaC family protein [Lutispora saccharofermentans]|uniref:Sodium:proton antiporter n=1 Tax=Lutispora saccharofermentans TaxID=3024236 RepID=A0ABT1NJ47_9FIRM|nr:Na+/H+ antiporter NhaC family protein [Lutispora saccharofermentans]MCQ1531290.1 sodium:proton antiporter [Lutispora saccharofermentans]
MEFGFLSVIPPIIAMTIAVLYKKVSLALLLGILTGNLLLCNWNVFHAVTSTVDGILSVAASVGNLKIFIFTSLMGAFVILATASGGVDGFVEYLTEQNKKIKNKKQAMLLGYLIGIIIFIDGLLSIMFTGVVTRPITDKYKVSREKLAYICDSTSAPINAIIPLNSWGAMLMGLIGTQIASGIISGDPMELLIKSLPFQLYSVVSILFVLFYIVTEKDWGPMKKAEERVIKTGKLYDDGVTPLMSDDLSEDEKLENIKPNKNYMLIPLLVLVGVTFVGLLITGSGNISKGDGTTSILYSIIITLIVMFMYYKKENIMTTKQFNTFVTKGIGNMLSLVMLLVLAFTIGNAISSLGTGKYLASLVEGKISGAFGPAIVFIIGSIMGFSTGTSWGTFAIMMPIAIPMAVSMNSNILISIGAVVSGGIFGDHCSPLSDTTILSSMSAGTDLYSHFKTQIPYALLSGAISLVLYIVFGLIM